MKELLPRFAPTIVLVTPHPAPHLGALADSHPHTPRLCGRRGTGTVNYAATASTLLRRRIHRRLHGAPLWLSLVGIAVEEYETVGEYPQGVVPKFLNRILGLEVARLIAVRLASRATSRRSSRAPFATGRARGIPGDRGPLRGIQRDRRACCAAPTPSSLAISSTLSSRTSRMDFETAKRKLEETRSCGARTPPSVRQLDGGDLRGRQHGPRPEARQRRPRRWINTRVTNVSRGNNRGFVSPAATTNCFGTGTGSACCSRARANRRACASS